MGHRFQTEDFLIEYIESDVRHSILWESHCHARYEMIAVIDGDITVLLEGQTCRLQKNQIIIISPLTYHSVMANGKGNYRRITALFGSDAIPAELRNLIAAQGRCAITSPVQLEKIKKLCQKSDQSFYAPLLRSLMVQLFYDTLQVSQEPETLEIDEFLQKALSYIDEHLHEKILLDDLARFTSRSKSSFCHLFEGKMKISPKQYILQKKIALASKLIDEGVSHTVAALQVGYENYSSFYRLYLKHYGATSVKKERNQTKK